MQHSAERDYLNGSDLAAAFGIHLTRICETGKVAVLQGSDGIMYLRYRTGATVDVEDFVEYHVYIQKHVQSTGKKARLLVDTARLQYLTKQARAAVASPEVSALFDAVAVVTRSPVMRAIGNFFIYIDNPSVPTRILEDTSEARKWLLSRTPRPTSDAETTGVRPSDDPR